MPSRGRPAFFAGRKAVLKGPSARMKSKSLLDEVCLGGIFFMILQAKNLWKEYGDRRLLTIDHLVIEEGDRIGLIGPNGAGKSTLLGILAGRIPPDHAVFEMKNVTYGYSRQEPPVLENFSLKVTPGKRVALVGASGSGKTTVAKLANGTLLPWSGEILLNGKPMNEYTRSEYYATVGTVDQSIMLFSGTVGQNLTLFAPSYEARELQQAVRDAAIEQELTARGPMLDLNVAEGGSNFSGGQRQRLEIARALTYRTPLLILDEATSALDPVTEVEIDKAIRRRGCACIVVAHRLSTIRDCDEIIMLDHGVVAERGTHETLMAAGGKYAAMMKLEQGD